MKTTCKTYEEDGIRYQFNAQNLLVQINRKKYTLQSSNKKVTKFKIMNEIADKLFVSVEAVKNWMYGYNGPSELEQVIMLGKYFDIDYHQLLVKEEGQMSETVNTNGIILDSQKQYTKEKIRDVYHAILEFVYCCRHYYGTLENDNELKTHEEKKVVLLANAELQAKFEQINRTLAYSMLDIPEKMYQKIHNYIWMELNDYIELIAPVEEVSELELEDIDYYYEMAEYLRKYLSGDFVKELRELFSDYIAKD